MNEPGPDFLLPPLTNATIHNRYKRFLADVELADGKMVTAHCPNTGSMTGCWEPGAPVQISYSDNPKRKLAWTLERVDMGQGWVGVNTARTNQIIESLISKRLIPGLDQFESLQREPRVDPDSEDRSRFDFLLVDSGDRHCYVEVKNTSLIHEGRICFPDAVSERGRKHLNLLAGRVDAGHDGVILFALNRPEGDVFSPASHVDPAYAETLQAVTAAGVKSMAVRLNHVADGIRYGGLVEIRLD